MKQHGNRLFGLRLRRLLSGLLCAAVLCGLLPEGLSLTGTARAAEARLSWTNEDLETLRSYDIMRGDEGGMRPNDTIRRSEFAAMVNRALGYTEKAAKNPFKDVTSKDWFFDDISISYNMGYLNGTSPTTVDPEGTLTREEALVILGRNLMLQPKVGESFSYADSRTFQEWSRGYIDPAVEAGVIDADRANNFTPQKIITRGELAGMVVRAIGTPIQTRGVRSLGTVDGNVTITTSGATLRNTTINGDLYLTGGIGLGDVLLDNVTVNGRIIDSGAGLSEKGEISVILNNVTADELIVDSMRNNTISLSARGNTYIPKTSLRTSARVEDSTAANYGLRVVEIDGEPKTDVTLSGNIKEAVNKTPDSTLNIGEGVAEKVTVDEAATNSSVTVGKDARIKYLNLDAGAKVTGSGGVDSLTISANGATVTLPLMPDEIVVAPGITATVNKQKLDSAAAAEVSARPRLMPGYPGTENLAPTSATALFMANKPGTIYWAITAKADGSPKEEDIISPPSYSKTIIKSGSVKVKEANKEYTAKISGLTADGSYYLSVIMVDDKGIRSTMKVTAFTTPDNSTPAFSKGYPEEGQISERDAQFAFMTTKDCYLYYVVLPKGSTAPRAIDFKTGSISGNMGYGVVKMAKNSPAYIFVNDVSLEEKVTYNLYLWLNDLDGAKSSAVKTMTFTTKDRTDPVITNLRQTKSTTTSVTAAYSLNEPGTLYWAVVKAGDNAFMAPTTSGGGSSNTKWLESREAMERVIAGTGALKSGKSSVAASKVGADVSFTVSGLNSKTTGTSSYDLYYVAVDAAGNWSKPILTERIYTDDKSNPTVVQKFTSFNQGDNEETLAPLADTDIRLVFSKPVRVVESVGGTAVAYNFMDARPEKLAELLKNKIRLYEGIPGNSVQVTDPPVIDYSKAEVYLDGTSMVVNFSHARGAVNLAPGTKYYFVISDTLSTDENRNMGMIQDTTANHNEMPRTTLKTFETKQAQVNITPLGLSEISNPHTGETKPVPIDFSFELEPRATGNSPDSICYDVVLWADKTLTFDVYRKPASAADTEWKPVRTTSSKEGEPGQFKYTIDNNTKEKTYYTVNRVGTTGTDYPALKDFQDAWQYAIHFKTVDGKEKQGREDWNISTHLGVSVVSGQKNDLRNLANGDGSLSRWKTCVSSGGGVSSIGNPPEFERLVTITDQKAPNLYGTYPQIDARDTSAVMHLMLDRPGTIYYVVTPVTNGGKTNPVPAMFYTNGYPGNDDPGNAGNTVPEDGSKVKHSNADTSAAKTNPEAELSEPSVDSMISKNLIETQGSVTNEGDSVTDVPLENLQADTWYYVYLAFKGNVQSERAVCYKFKTDAAYEPVIALTTDGTSKAGMVKATITESSANVNARLIPVSSLGNTFYSLKMDGSDAAASRYDFAGPWSKDTNAKNYTILNAMMTRSNDKKGTSVFDEIATPELKNYVADLIKTGSSSEGAGSIATKALTIPVGKSDEMEFPGLAQNLEYFCVAVAENTSDSSKRGFRSVRPVEVVDTNPATVTNATGNLRIVAVEDATNHKTTYVLTGTVSISYAGYLYVNDGDRTTRPFTQGGDQKGLPFFGPNDGNFKRDWAGAASITSINSTGMFEVRPTGSSSVATMTQTLVLTVKDNRTDDEKTNKIPEGFVLETRDWTEKTQTESTPGTGTGSGTSTTTKEWVKPEYPVVSGSILFPTEIVNRNGTTPTNTGTISYTNVSGKVTGSNVTVSYKK